MHVRGTGRAESLDAMLAGLPGRQRDAGATWTAGGVALGWRGATADDDLTGRLPLADRRAGLAVTASCRLDDRASLCDSLGVPHAQRAGMPDGALILRAYERWEADCLDHLLGDYAFALWDAKRRRLLCARDHVGARPLYYCSTAERVVFASDPSAVLAAPGVADDLDEAALATRLTYGSRPLGEHTFYRAVRKLLPGHRLLAADGSIRVERWWRPEDVPAAAPADDDALAETFLELYSRAVEDRVGGPHSVGVHLSGGLDSSSIAVLAARALRRAGRPAPLAFSWQPPPGDGARNAAGTSEHRLIEAVCRQEALGVRYCPLSVDDLVGHLRRDEARDLNVHVNEVAVQRCAADSGVRVLLSGWGGDEGISFNGRGWYPELLRDGRLGALLAGNPPEQPLPGRERPYPRRAAARGPGRRRVPERDGEAGRRATTPSSTRRSHGACGCFAPAAPPLPVGMRQTRLHLLRLGHLGARIDGWAASGARYGIEYRYPLLDRRVLEFALGLPPEQFRRGRWSRWLMRRALGGILPSEVCWNRDKRDPARLEALRGVCAEAFAVVRAILHERPGPLTRCAYVDMRRLRDRLDRVPADSRKWPGALLNALRFLDF